MGVPFSKTANVDRVFHDVFHPAIGDPLFFETPWAGPVEDLQELEHHCGSRIVKLERIESAKNANNKKHTVYHIYIL